MKACKTCKKEKPLSSFYAHKKMADGHLNICKDCTKIRVSNHRELNIEYIKEYDKKRANLPKRVIARKNYAKTEAGKKAHARALKKYRENYHQRYATHIIFCNAVRDGKVEKLPCLICGNEAEGHHPDYSKPLDVIWLCNKHHREAHNLTKNLKEQDGKGS
jgi:hypothetical protein